MFLAGEKIQQTTSDMQKNTDEGRLYGSNFKKLGK